MRVLLILVVVTFNVVLVSSQFKNPIHRFGNFRSTTRPPSTFITSQYRPTNRNRIYNEDNSGQYRPEIYNRNDDNGRYFHDDSGKYVHVDTPYDGGYGDNGNRGGYYTGDYQRYQHQTGPSGAYRKDSSTSSISHFSGSTPRSFIPSANPRPVILNKNVNSNTKSNYGIQVSAANRFRTYGNEGGWRILRLDKDIHPIGYSYAYQTENKIIGEEAGRLSNPGAKDEAVKASGFYEYEGDDGKTYRVEYTADENGFVPKGTHIPEGIEEVARLASKN